MKTFIIASSLFLSLVALNTATTEPETETPDYLERSEILFCQSRGYDPDNMTPAQVDEFNDCWRGSVEEENAMQDD